MYDNICSAAKCLGARRVCQQAYQWLSEHKILSCVIEDKQAASACLQFAGEYQCSLVSSCLVSYGKCIAVYILILALL